MVFLHLDLILYFLKIGLKGTEREVSCQSEKLPDVPALKLPPTKISYISNSDHLILKRWPSHPQRQKVDKAICLYQYHQQIRDEDPPPRFRVTKTPSARRQCCPESFCKSGKLLRQVHYCLKNFRILCNTKYPDNMQSVRMNWKVSGQSKKCLDNLENVSG